MPVCSFGKRIFSFPTDWKRSCQHCGRGVKTPLWIYGAMAAVGGAAAWGWYRAEGVPDPLFFWEMSRGSLVLFFWAYFLSGAVLMWLVPFRSCPEMKPVVPTRGYRPVVRLKKSFPYAADHVYAAASSALRRADGYKILEKHPEERRLYLSRDGAAPRLRLELPNTGNTYSCYVDLRVGEREDGGAEVRVEVTWKWGNRDWEQNGDILGEICQWISHDLELFHYPEIAT